MNSLYNRNKARLLSLGRLFHFYLQSPKSFVLHKADFINYLPTMENNSSTVIIFTVNKKSNACKKTLQPVWISYKLVCSTNNLFKSAKRCGNQIYWSLNTWCWNIDNSVIGQFPKIHNFNSKIYNFNKINLERSCLKKVFFRIYISGYP